LDFDHWYNLYGWVYRNDEKRQFGSLNAVIVYNDIKSNVIIYCCFYTSRIDFQWCCMYVYWLSCRILLVKCNVYRKCIVGAKHFPLSFVSMWSWFDYLSLVFKFLQWFYTWSQRKKHSPWLGGIIMFIYSIICRYVPI